MTTRSEVDKKPTKAKKTTRFMTSSDHMVKHMSARCTKDHVHQHLVGGRCAAAAFDPLPLVRAILKGICDTALAEQKSAEEEVEFMKIINALCSGESEFPHDANLPEMIVPDVQIKKSKINKTPRGYLSISYDNWKHCTRMSTLVRAFQDDSRVPR